MGVTIRKRRGKWYVFVNHHGCRKSKYVGSSRQTAEQVRRQLEAKLALGDMGFLSETSEHLTFEKYAQRWLKTYAELECKPSTVRNYEQLLRVHVTPRFGAKALTEIRRDEIKQFLSELSTSTRIVHEIPVLKFSRNTLRLIVSALRSVLNAAVEEGLIESNPASKVGKFAKTEKQPHQASAMTRSESEKFLAAVKDLFEEWWVFFLTALRAGVRKGELIALKWGDIQFGESEEDSNRYIVVQRNYSQGRFTSPKSKKSRRVDLSRQLRAALLELRDARLLTAMMAGKSSIADDLVFPFQAGTVVKPHNIVPRYMNLRSKGLASDGSGFTISGTHSGVY